MIFLPCESLAGDVFCFTTSVHGGVSDTPYKSFNLGLHVHDNELRVATNRELLNAIIMQQVANRQLEKASAIRDNTIFPIMWLNQQHTNLVCEYNHENILRSEEGRTKQNVEPENQFACDAIFTEEKLRPLVVMSADCLPIVISCRNTGKIAAIHAGYRGLLTHIIANTLRYFSDTNALSVWIGPSISQANFQISGDIVEQFSQYKQAVIAQKSHKYLVDLALIAKLQLTELGVNTVQVSPVCSYGSEDCFSHRRATHAGLSQTGRMATVIVRV